MVILRRPGRRGWSTFSVLRQRSRSLSMVDRDTSSLLAITLKAIPSWCQVIALPLSLLLSRRLGGMVKVVGNPRLYELVNTRQTEKIARIVFRKGSGFTCITVFILA